LLYLCIRWINPFDCESALRDVLPHFKSLRWVQDEKKSHLFYLEDVIARICEDESASAKACVEMMTKKIGVYRKHIMHIEEWLNVVGLYVWDNLDPGRSCHETMTDPNAE